MTTTNLKDGFKRYLLVERGLNVKTYKNIVSTLGMVVAYAKTDVLRDLNNGIMREFLCNGAKERLWEPKTYRNHWQNLKSFFDWCVKSGYLTKNPTDGIEKPKLKKRLPRCLSKEDALKVLYHTASYDWKYKLDHSRNEALITTMMFSGLRIQELLDLQVTDINFSDGSILVRQGKGNKDRLVPIHPQLMPKLRGYFQERLKVLSPSTWFFTGIKSDKKLYQKDIRRIIKKISIASGVMFTAHMLRHTFGKLMVEGDLNLYKIKEIMGHEHISTTQIYLSVSPESIKRSFDLVRIL